VNSLRGRRALVTGGSRGIGAATALLFAEYGVDVAIGYRSRKEDATAIVDKARDTGVKAFAYAQDISSHQGAETLVRSAAADLGGLDFFVGNAGIWPADEVPVTDMDDVRWRRTMMENIDSMFFTTRAAARVMNDNGRIVLVSSTAGQRGEAFHADYAASKGAMISYVKSLCVEVARRGITVNSVAPGWVDTEMCEGPFANGGRERIAASIPLGRVAHPRDIAGPILFLCSELGRHVTGEILNVNGGSVLVG
jgi:3-oxoacyl-[acyl-carrier protein] reductase